MTHHRPLQLLVQRGAGRYIPRNTFAPFVYNRVLQREKVSAYDLLVATHLNHVLGKYSPFTFLPIYRLCISIR